MSRQWSNAPGRGDRQGFFIGAPGPNRLRVIQQEIAPKLEPVSIMDNLLTRLGEIERAPKLLVGGAAFIVLVTRLGIGQEKMNPAVLASEPKCFAMNGITEHIQGLRLPFRPCQGLSEPCGRDRIHGQHFSGTAELQSIREDRHRPVELSSAHVIEAKTQLDQHARIWLLMGREYL